MVPWGPTMRWLSLHEPLGIKARARTISSPSLSTRRVPRDREALWRSCPSGHGSLAAALEPVAGQVYFSPEAHQGYETTWVRSQSRRLWWGGRNRHVGVFTSRGSVMGQVPGEVVAAAFGVFNPTVVVGAVDHGWSLTNAATICTAGTRCHRTVGAHPRREAAWDRPSEPTFGSCGRRSTSRRTPALCRNGVARPARSSGRRHVAAWPTSCASSEVTLISMRGRVPALAHAKCVC